MTTQNNIVLVYSVFAGENGKLLANSKTVLQIFRENSSNVLYTYAITSHDLRLAAVSTGIVILLQKQTDIAAVKEAPFHFICINSYVRVFGEKLAFYKQPLVK